MNTKTPIPAPELTVVIPTYNEAENVDPLLAALREALDGESWEVIFVDDDSRDGTSNVIRTAARADNRIRLIQRIGRKGLASACVEGMLASASQYVAVMDGDMQHDETLLPQMLNRMRRDDLDVVVASRTDGEGSYGAMDRKRVWISRLATRVARMVLKVPLSDPMSGHFMLKRSIIDEIYGKLYGQGYKILLDICAAAPQRIRFAELPYTMRSRRTGESKLSGQVAIEYVIFLATHWFGRIVPARFVLFSLVGLTGVGVHMAALGMLHIFFVFEFSIAQLIATFLAMTSNFILNNRFTFRHKRLYGIALFKGLFGFYVVCSIGAVIGLATGELLYRLPTAWWLAGLVTTIASAFWNFTMSSMFTWKDATATRIGAD